MWVTETAGEEESKTLMGIFKNILLYFALSFLENKKKQHYLREIFLLNVSHNREDYLIFLSALLLVRTVSNNCLSILL